MTKKDFELIAETIANAPCEHKGLTGLTSCMFDKNYLIQEMADMLASTNSRFDRDRFIKACNTENYRAPKNITRY